MARHGPAIRTTFLLTPVVILFGVFYIYPLIELLPISFTARLEDGQRIGPTLDQYLRFVGSDFYVVVLADTLRISLVVTLAALLLGYPVAYLMAQLKLSAVKWLMILILLPFWTSILVRTYAWMVLLQRRGVVNSFLMETGIIEQPLPLMFNEAGVVIGMTQIMLPFMILPVYSVLRGLDIDLVRAASGLGASSLQTFSKITFPLSMPGVGAGVLIVFIVSLGFFVTPSLLGGGKVPMLAATIEIEVNNLLNWEFAAAAAVILLAVTVAVVVAFQRMHGLERMWGEST